MLHICPICTEACLNTQNSIHCVSCDKWIHHNNRNNCSGLTDTEFESHKDASKHWECDNCTAKINTTVFLHLPFIQLENDSFFDLTGRKKN